MKKQFFTFLFASSFLLSSQSKDVSILQLKKSLKTAISKNEKMNLLLELGDFYLEQDLIQSEKYFNKAQQFVQFSDDINNAVLNEKLAVLYRKKGKYSEATQFGMHAENLFIKLKDTAGIVRSLISLGITNRFRNKNRQSINYYKRAVKLSEKKNFTILLGRTYNMMGIAYRRLNKLDSAMLKYTKAKKIFEKHRHQFQKVSVNNNLAVLHSSRGEYEKSLPIFLSNLRFNIIHKKKMSVAIGYFNVAMDYYKKKELEKAFVYIDSSCQLSKEQGFQFRVLKALELKGKIREKQKDYVSALNYSKLFHVLSDSIFNVEKENNLREFELSRKFNLEKRELEIKAIEQKEKNQLYIFILFLLLALGSLITYLLLKNSKGKNKYLATKIEKQQLQEALLDEKVKVSEADLKRLIADNSMRLSYLKLFSERLKNDHDKFGKSEVKNYIKKLQFDLQQQVTTEDKLSSIQHKITDVNRGFEQKIFELYPKLTKSEREVCALLRINLTIKETATIRNTTIEAIKSIRYRLRKKLSIPKDMELDNFIQNL